MKKTILTLAIAMIGYCANAQNNTFQSTGDAILGLQGYTGNAIQFSGWGEAPFLRTESIGNSGNGNTRLRLYLTDDWTYDQGFEVIAKRYDGPQRSLLYIPGDGSNAAFFGGASFGGNVGIGTSTPDAKLAVNGTIHTKEVKVDLQNWPDYVFKPNYQLPSLSEVKAYINKKQHLPDMPSEQEVAKNGVNLGEINKLLTKKVEELTLYAIEQKEELNEQQQKSEKQDARIAELERALLKLAGK